MILENILIILSTLLIVVFIGYSVIKLYPTKRLYMVVSMGLALVTSLTSLYVIYVNAKPKTAFSEKDENFKILLLPFSPDINCKDVDIFYERILINRLLSLKKKDNLAINIKFNENTACPLTVDEANSISKQNNADLVIWGSYQEDCINDSIKLRLQYSLDSKFFLGKKLSEGDSELQTITSISNIKQGVLQGDIDYIIYWIEGIHYYSKHEYKKALSYFEKVIPKEPGLKLDEEMCLRIGDIYLKLGQYNKSEIYYSRGLEILSNKNDSSNLIASIQSRLAKNYLETQRYQDAIFFEKKALVIWQRLADTIGILRSNAKLGEISSKLDKMDEAKLYYQKSLDLISKSITIGDSELAQVYSNLSMIDLSIDNFKSSISNSQKALSLFLNSKDSINAAEAYNNLSMAYFHIREMDSAKVYQDMSIDIFISKLGENNSRVGRMYNNLAVIHTKLENFDLALQYSIKAKNIADNYSIPSIRVSTYKSLAVVYYKKDQYEEAMNCLKEAQKIVLEAYGPNSEPHRSINRQIDLLRMMSPY